MGENPDMVRIFVASATMTKRSGFSVDVSGFTYVTLARNKDEARGAMLCAALNQFPGYAIEGHVAVDAIDEDAIREAAINMGMRDA